MKVVGREVLIWYEIVPLELTSKSQVLFLHLFSQAPTQNSTISDFRPVCLQQTEILEISPPRSTLKNIKIGQRKK